MNDDDTMNPSNPEDKKDFESIHEYAKRNQILMRLASYVVAYDKAIITCANDPEKMISFCTTEGDNLDDLYFDMVNLSTRIVTGKDASIEIETEDQYQYVLASIERQMNTKLDEDRERRFKVMVKAVQEYEKK